METTWIVVADSASAKLLEVRSMLSPPVLIETLENPQARMRPSELLSDHGSHTPGTPGPEETVKETLAIRFAILLATRLNEAREQRAFGNLVLICAPGFLGLLRDALSKDVGRRVVSSMAKDLSHEPNLAQRVQRLVRDAMQYTV